MGQRKLNSRDKKIGLWIVTIFIVAIFAYAFEHAYLVAALQMMVLISGFMLCYHYACAIKKSIASKTWPKVPYDIYETRVELVDMTADHHRKQYHPYFSFCYLYDGETYKLDSTHDINLSVGRVFYKLTDAQQYLQEVKDGLYGAHVAVNPNRPEQAFIRSGMGRDQWGMMIFGILLIALPIINHFEWLTW